MRGALDLHGSVHIFVVVSVQFLVAVSVLILFVVSVLILLAIFVQILVVVSSAGFGSVRLLSPNSKPSQN